MEVLLHVEGLERSGLAPASFRLRPGECVAIEGPSGAGKTLLLRALADLDPSDGVVELEGVAREDTPAPTWRRRVAYLPSESGWWCEHVGEHFADWNAVEPLVERLGFDARVRGWTVQRLSTGERQRLALARLLAGEPRVLLLDEPTSGLDERATARVEELIAERLAAGAAALWVSHDAAQRLRVARRRLRVDAGRIGEIGEVGEGGGVG